MSRNSSPVVLAIAAVTVLALAASAGADPILVPNAGFEDRATIDEDTGTPGIQPMPDGYDRYNQWALETWRHFESDNNGGPLRIWNPGIPGVHDDPQGAMDVGFGGNAPGGDYVVVVRTRYNDDEFHDPPQVRDFEAAVQLLPETFDPTMTYTLTAKVGRLPDGPAEGGSVNYDPSWYGYALQFAVGGTNVDGARYQGRVEGGTILAQDNNSLTVPANGFVTSTVTYTPNPADAIYAGLPIQIRLAALEDPADHSLTQWAAFDDVTLDGTSGPVAAETIITGTVAGPNGSHDTWNEPNNWDNGIPSGAIDAVVGAGVTAQVWNPATPAYTGSLTLEDNSTLQLGWTTHYPENLNALGGSDITFNDGSELRLRLPMPVTLPEIALEGDASIHLSPSTSAHHQARNFDDPIIGTGALTVTGNNNNTLNLNLANPGWSGDFIANADDGWRVEANASGAFGTGDVTFNARAAGDRGATLIIDAPDVIADTATLFLNGPRDQREAAKLILNANDTVAGFWLDGVQMAAGDYTSLSGLTDVLGNSLIAGSGILTVLGGVGPPPDTPVTILSTDFTGRTVSGATASNIPWVTNGVADPGDLTAVPVGGGTFGGLFDTADAQGHFAPDRNTGNEGPWSVDIPIDLTAPEVVIEDIVLDWQHFNNSGNFQGVNRSVDWTATVTGSLSGEIGAETALNISGTSGEVTISFASPLTLTDSESWTLQILAEGSNTTGNNTGLDAINVLGQVGAAAVVPEPSTFVLAALGLLGLAFYARRRRQVP